MTVGGGDIGAVSNRIAGLSSARRRLFELLSSEAGAAAVREEVAVAALAVPGGPFSLLSVADRERLPDGVEDAYPLTHMQAGMLYHMELTSDYPLYHNVDSWHLRTRFEQARFERAVQRVVARHPVLRTAFDLTSYSELLQLVYRKAVLPVPVVDLRQLDATDQDGVLAAFVEREKRRRFDYGRPPLLRFHVHLRSTDTFQFTITEFHPILDGWSLQSTLAEILRHYSALLRGERLPESVPLACTFRDYVALERAALASEESRRYWQDKLAGCSILELPRWPERYRRPQGRSYTVLACPLPDRLLDRLRGLARSARVPFKSVCVATHVKVLALLTGQRDVLTGLIVHGRPESEDGDQVRGLFLNTVPLRLDLGSLTFDALVRAAFDAEQELVPHRRFPLAAVQERWGRQRLVECALNVTHFHVYDEETRTGGGDRLAVGTLGGMELEENSFTLCATFGMDPWGAHLQMLLLYDRRELADPQATAIGGYYRRVLEAMADYPESLHDAVPLMTAAERHQLLWEWNDTITSIAAGRALHHFIEAQVDRTPDAVAVELDESYLTYLQLDRRANSLAHRLRRFDTGAEPRVGIFMERSLATVVGLVAVLKAGGAYVPLDPEYPAAAITFMLRDCEAALVLGTGAPGVELCLDLEEAVASAAESDERPAGSGGDALAYVIYTSGSTGRSKGAMNTHAAVINRLLWMQASYGLDASDRVLHKTPLSFDVSVWELFWPLLAGARLVLARPGGHRDSAYLVDLIGRARVTTVHFVPSMLQTFLEEENLEPCGCLRRVICSGEALSADLSRAFSARLGTALYNLYGPTEAAVDVTAWHCEGTSGTPTLPIGRPIDNLLIRLLDRGAAMTPMGVAAELYIGGAGLARGYHGRPELTAERFVPDPFAERPGERLYRTGDRARYLPDGSLEFLGRLDFQVKIRGVRIELGEVEAALVSHPEIREAAAAAWQIDNESRLVAFLVAASAPAPAPEQLRVYLRSILPEGKIPARFIFLDHFPLTPSGKLDRRALRVPAAERELRAICITPRTPLERTIAAIWREVLGIEEVGVEDAFFDLGGHSLLLLRVHKKLVAELAVNLSLTDLFRYPTVSALAAHLAAAAPPEEVAAQAGQGRGGERKSSIAEREQMREKRQRARGTLPGGGGGAP